MSYLFTTQRTTSPLHRAAHITANAPRMSAKQFKVYLKLREIGVKPRIAMEIVFEWFTDSH